jgi:hypothetical protein
MTRDESQAILPPTTNMTSWMIFPFSRTPYFLAFTGFHQNLTTNSPHIYDFTACRPISSVLDEAKRSEKFVQTQRQIQIDAYLMARSVVRQA